MRKSEIKALGPLIAGYRAVYSSYYDLSGLHVMRHYVRYGERHTRCLLGLDAPLVELARHPDRSGDLRQCSLCSRRIKHEPPKKISIWQYRILRRACAAPVRFAKFTRIQVLYSLEVCGLLRWSAWRTFEITDIGRQYVEQWKEIYEKHGENGTENHH